MKKLIFKFWIFNILISIALFIIYRIVISETEVGNDSFFETFMLILDLLLSLGYSLIYLIGMLISSLVLFLNLFEKIGNHFYLSMLTFLGIPIAVTVYIIWTMYLDNDLSADFSINFLRTFLIFLLIYLISNLVQFLIFRKKISASLPDSANRGI